MDNINKEVNNLVNIANTIFELGLVIESLELSRIALDFNQSSENAWNLQFKCLVELGRHKDMVKALRTYSKLCMLSLIVQDNLKEIKSE